MNDRDRDWVIEARDLLAGPVLAMDPFASCGVDHRAGGGSVAVVDQWRLWISAGCGSVPVVVSAGCGQCRPDSGFALESGDLGPAGAMAARGGAQWWPMPETIPAKAARSVPVDAVCRAALELARDAIVAIAPAEHVGQFLGVTAEEERVVTHRFKCTAAGYRGWFWAVTVARAPRARNVTVDEVVLLPGEEALLAPAWVPWSQRVAPGDLGVGDVLPTPIDDERLAAGWSGVDDLAAACDDAPLRPPGWELGIGRKRVLSAIGRDQAAARWLAGPTGPATAMARSAPGNCGSCGFLMPIGGPTGGAFGVCANALSPADGRVVALDFGCGGHSEAAI